jgi:CRISPR system Cascade subunit CasD
MPDLVVFRLYGPMAAWGDVAVGEERPSFSSPTKSGVFGLLAAALGITRTEDDRHRDLAESFWLGMLVNSPGTLLRDFHTVQVPPESAIRKQAWVQTRRDELAIPRDDLGTIVSRREYVCDGLVTVFLWPTGRGSGAFTPELVVKALASPAFVLYLGRKSCPLALPTGAQVVENAASIQEAYARASFPAAALDRLQPDGAVRLYWEGGIATGFSEAGVLTFRRRDGIRSRSRRQFADRPEQYAMVAPGGRR